MNKQGAEKLGAGGGSRTLTGLLSPADFLTVYGFRRPDAVQILIRFAVWTIPSPSPGMIRALGATRLVSTPSRLSLAGLGSGLPLMRRFPRLWAVLHRRFPGEHSSFVSSPLRLPFRHARVAVQLPS